MTIDSHSVINLADSWIFHERTKNINARLHFFRHVEFKEVRIVMVTLEENLVDVFIKFAKIDIQMLLEVD